MPMQSLKDRYTTPLYAVVGDDGTALTAVAPMIADPVTTLDAAADILAEWEEEGRTCWVLDIRNGNEMTAAVRYTLNERLRAREAAE